MLKDHVIYLRQTWVKVFVGLSAQVCSPGLGDIMPFLSASPFKFFKVQWGWEVSFPSSLRARVLCIWQTDVSVLCSMQLSPHPWPVWVSQLLRNTPAAWGREKNVTIRLQKMIKWSNMANPPRTRKQIYTNRQQKRLDAFGLLYNNGPLW